MVEGQGGGGVRVLVHLPDGREHVERQGHRESHEHEQLSASRLQHGHAPGWQRYAQMDTAAEQWRATATPLAATQPAARPSGLATLVMPAVKRYGTAL